MSTLRRLCVCLCKPTLTFPFRRFGRSWQGRPLCLKMRTKTLLLQAILRAAQSLLSYTHGRTRAVLLSI